MAYSYSPNPLEHSHDRLGFALCVALALHAAVILGIGFSKQPRQQAAPRLEITLAQHKSEKKPQKADFIAQHDQQGSGTLEDKAMLTSQQLADYKSNEINEISTPQQSRAQNASDAPLLSSRLGRRSTLALIQEQEAKPDRQSQDSDINEISREIASLEAKLDIQRQAYAKRPRIRRLTSVSTQFAEDARYLHNWRNQVEAIGNKNYPQAAKQQHLYGELRLLVSLLPSGDIYKIELLSSSGHKILDQAAIQIVHLAAPFEPFPLEMSRKVDVLEIIRTWRFHQGRLSAEH